MKKKKKRPRPLSFLVHKLITKSVVEDGGDRSQERKMMRVAVGSRRRRGGGSSVQCLLIMIACAMFAGIGLLILTLMSVDPSINIIDHLHIYNNTTTATTTHDVDVKLDHNQAASLSDDDTHKHTLLIVDSQTHDATTDDPETKPINNKGGCATVEEMGATCFLGPASTARFWDESSLRVREIIRHHFLINGASRVRGLPPEQFCRHGFVIGKASEAGFGNEMYKILTAAALSVMLNRSLIIGQTRGKYPFGDYISYSNLSFTLKEVKHLWRQNGCVPKYGRHLVMRIDDFQKPAQTHVLCSNWRKWEQPIIWFQNTTDAVAAQFFLKNIHIEMRKRASDLFGRPENLQHRPNVFGELMRVLISPSENVARAVNWALAGGVDPDIALHMRMLMNRPVRAMQAALGCIRKAVQNLQVVSRPRVVLVSDTPSVVEDIASHVHEFAEVLHFDYDHFEGNVSGKVNGLHNLKFRVKDWGPAPRWVAFVDFFLASRAKHAVVSGAHRRVGTTYAQLIAALAAAQRLEANSSAGSNFSFFSSFQSNLLSEGLRNQIGWGHVWNRFAGPLSCRKQSNQCALTPLLPPAWWDGLWQSPISRDVRRMEAFGIQLSGFGTFDGNHLRSFCNLRKHVVATVQLI